jgi:hypothetical protein
MRDGSPEALWLSGLAGAGAVIAFLVVFAVLLGAGR